LLWGIVFTILKEMISLAHLQFPTIAFE